MTSDAAVPGTISRGHPILLISASFPVACFIGALCTDIAYVVTANVIWVDFSDWLLAVGMVGGVVAAIAGLVSLVRRRRDLARRSVWPAVLGSVLVLAIGFLNNLVHSRDGWTSVMPLGLALSVITVLVVLMTVWLAVGTRRPRDRAIPYPGGRR
ncbi:MAG: DUF2231 domain-containing protein [Alphaproteobacteria bacterium]|nr:DUF2231 domain-containing protein [Alphaproteobacteria bacterium]